MRDSWQEEVERVYDAALDAVGRADSTRVRVFYRELDLDSRPRSGWAHVLRVAHDALLLADASEAAVRLGRAAQASFHAIVFEHPALPFEMEELGASIVAAVGAARGALGHGPLPSAHWAQHVDFLDDTARLASARDRDLTQQIVDSAADRLSRGQIIPPDLSIRNRDAFASFWYGRLRAEVLGRQQREVLTEPSAIPGSTPAVAPDPLIERVVVLLDEARASDESDLGSVASAQVIRALLSSSVVGTRALADADDSSLSAWAKDVADMLARCRRAGRGPHVALAVASLRSMDDGSGPIRSEIVRGLLFLCLGGSTVTGNRARRIERWGPAIIRLAESGDVVR